MPAPTKHPDWATDGTNVIEAPAGKVAGGWLPAEQPPAGWFNWWQNLVGQWTRWLEERIDALQGEHDGLADDAAIKSEANVFTQTQVIDVDPDAAMLYSSRKISDDGANRWKLVIAVPTQDAAWAALFAGQSPEGCALVNNAQWNVATQLWEQLDPNYPSTALVGRSGVFLSSFVPAGESLGPGTTIPPWADWPEDGGGDLMAGGNIQANGAVPGSGLVIARNAFRYLAPKSHTTRKGIWGGSGEGVMADTAWVFGGGIDTPCIQLVTAGDSHMWPILLPHGAKLSKIEVFMDKAGIAAIGPSGPGVASFVARTAPLVPPLPVADAVVAYNDATSASGNVTVEINIGGGGHTIDLALAEYYVRVKGADAGDKVYGFALTWSEPGIDCYGG